MAQQAVEKVGPSKHNFNRTGRMALYGGGTNSSFPPPSLVQTPSDLTPPPRSRLRPRSNNLVLIPRPPHQLTHLPQPHDSRACPDRSDGLCIHESLLLLVFDGDYGGDGPGGEGEGDLLGGVEEELDGVAGGAGSEFQVRAIGASGFGCECC